MDAYEASERLRRRLAKFGFDQDQTGLLTAPAEEELTTLCNHLESFFANPQEHPVDPALLQVAGISHWYRYLLSPRGTEQSEHEYSEALIPLQVVYLWQPDAVPPDAREVLGWRTAQSELRQLLRNVPTDARGERIEVLTQIMVLLGKEFQRTRMTVTIKGFVEVTRELAGINPSAAVYAALANALVTVFERTTELGVIDEAIEILEREIDNSAPGQERDLMSLVLANATGVRAQWYRRAARLIFESEPGENPVAVGLRLRMQFDHTGDASLLDQAIDILSLVAAEAPSAAGLAELGIALRTRFQYANNKDDLTHAVARGKEAVRAAVSAEDRELALNALGATLGFRYNVDQRPETLEEAIATLRAAVAIMPQLSQLRASTLTNLGIMLDAKSRSERSLDALTEAIDYLRAAATATPPDDPYLPVTQVSLGKALRWRAGLVGGSTDDLEEALEVQRLAVASPHSRAMWATTALELAETLADWHAQVTDHAALDEAIDLLRDALDLPGSAAHISTQIKSALGSFLAMRGQIRTSTADLEEAVELLQDVRAHYGKDVPATVLSNLGGALRYLYEDTGNPAHLELAIESLEAATDKFDASGSAGSAARVGLAQALLLRFAIGENDSDRTRANEFFASVASNTSIPESTRTIAAAGWAALAQKDDRPADAVSAYRILLDLLLVRVPAQIRRDAQEQQVGRFAAIGSDAAACALDAGDRETALSFLEQGRGILLAEILNRRTGMAELRHHAPELSEEWAKIAHDLSEYSSGLYHDLGDVGGTYRSWTVDRHHQILAKRAELTERIRQKDGLTRFLLPPTAEDLQAEAADGPVVMINLSDRRCDAITLLADHIDALPLRNLDPVALEDRVVEFHTAIARAADHGEDPEVQAEAEQIVVNVLEWLWDVIASPILDHLGIRGPVDHKWPRIWWSPTGLLNFLPLHAAGRPGGDCVLDRVISSYVPTIGTLREARRSGPGRTHRPPAILLVAVPNPGGGLGLQGVEREVRYLLEQYDSVHPLLGGQAVPGIIMDQLPRHRWVHFACHALNDLGQPTNSHIIVHGGAITIRDISALYNEDAELAFLAVCDSAFGSPELADEAVHLGAAFQLAGYRQVIGTLWSTADDVAAQVVKSVYHDLSTAAEAETLPGALALHRATRGVRDAYPLLPSLWAGYIHLGG